MPSSPPGKPHVAVLGAGAFGGWTALWLRRRGCRVTLLDPWGPGNSRSSSGGETRIIRANYGRDSRYVEMCVRAMTLWNEFDAARGTKLFNRSGFMWLEFAGDPEERASLAEMKRLQVDHEELNENDASKRFPHISFDGLKYAIYEPDGGYLFSRRACMAVLDAFVAEGGEYRMLGALPGQIANGCMSCVKLSNGSELRADQFVFACGPWLGQVLPDVLGSRIRPTRQEVFFFGPPPGDDRFLEPKTPCWVANGEEVWYGIPGNDGRGFKLAIHDFGPPTDPTTQDRIASMENAEKAREYLGLRFPAMRCAPLVESRVCQYENSPDDHFIIDRHPEAENAWIVGGGSGHGFKHGPVVGEMAADMVLEHRSVEPGFSLERFK